MRKTSKRTILSLLIGAISVLFALCLAACGKQPVLTFVAPEVTFRVGNNIDCYDFIVKESGVDYTFTVKNSTTGDVVSVGDRTFYAKAAGEYTLSVTASRGGSSIEGGTSFHVYDTMPVASLSGSKEYSYAVEYPLDELVPLDLLFVRSDTSVEYILESVTYYRNPYVYDYYNVGGGDLSTATEEEVREYDLTGSASDDGLYDGNGNLYFKYEGLYDFTLAIKNAGGVVRSSFTANVTENVARNYVELTENEVVFDNYVSQYASWTAVEGASSYRVKIDYENVYTDETNSYEDGGKVYFDVRKYLVSEYTDFQSFDLIVFPLNEKGKPVKVDALDASGNPVQRSAKITLSEVIIAPEAQKNALIGNSTRVFIAEDGVATATTTGKRASMLNWGTVHTINSDYIAWKGDYGVGYYVDFTFTGNNVPMVCFFADAINGDITQRDASNPQKGLLVMCGGINGNYSAGAYKNYYGESIVVWGPNRMNGGSNGSMWDGFVRVMRGEDYQYLTQNYLQDDKSGTVYRYTVGTYSEGEGDAAELYLDVRLFDVTNPQNEKQIYNYHMDTGVFVKDLPAANIIAYGPMKPEAEDATFTFGTPYLDTPQLAEVEVYNAYPNTTEMTDKTYTTVGRAVEDPTAELTLNGSYVNGAGYEYQAARMNNSYLAFNGDYGVGNYLEVEFQGNNLPQVVFFANKTNGNLTNFTNVQVKANQPVMADIAQNRGLLLTSGFVNKAGNDNTLFGRFSVYGMDRIYPLTAEGEPAINKGALKTYKALYSYEYSDYGGEGNAFTQPWLNLHEEQTLRYLVGTIDVGGKLYIDATVYDPETGETLGKILENTGLSAEEAGSGKILLFATAKGEGLSTKLKITKMPTLLQGEPLDQIVKVTDGTLLFNGLRTSSGAFHTGDKVTVTADADTRYQEFSAWKIGEERVEEREYELTVGEEDVVAVASYDVWYEFSVVGGTAVAEEDGREGRYLPDTPITLTANTPEAGYEFLRWVDEEGRSRSSQAVYQLKKCEGAEILTAVYRKTGEETPVVTSGATPSEDGSYTLAGYGLEKISGAGWTSFLGNIDNSYVAYDGEFGVGTYLEFTFTGNNLPQVMFFADTIDGKMTGYTHTGSGATAQIYSANERRGLLLTNGFYNGDSLTTQFNGGKNTFKVWGMNRITPTSINNAYGYVKGALYSYVYGEGENDLFTQVGLNAAEDTQYAYLVGTVNVGGEIWVDATIYEVATKTVMARILAPTGVTDLTLTGSIVAYATVKGVGNDTVFTVTKAPTLLREGEYSLMTLTGATVTQNGLAQRQGLFQEGDVVRVTADADTEFSRYAYLADADGNTLTEARTYEFSFEGEPTHFKAVVKSLVKVVGGTFENGTTEEFFLADETFTVMAGAPETDYEFLRWVDENGSRLSGESTAILTAREGGLTVTAAYRKSGEPAPIVTSGATLNSDGSYTLKGGLITNPSGFAYSIADVDHSYVAFDGEFGVGYSIGVTFKGNNLPQVMLLADKIDGHVAGFTYQGSGAGATHSPTGGKGLLLTNGYYAYNNLTNGGCSSFTVWGMNRYLPKSVNGAYSAFLSSSLYSYYLNSKQEAKTVGALAKTGIESSGDMTAWMQSTLSEAENAETEYKYVVSISEEEEKLVVTATLSKADGNGGYTELVKLICRTEYASTLTGSIVLYAASKGEGTGKEASALDTTFTCTAPVKE